METLILKGKPVVEKIYQDLKNQIDHMDTVPRLTVVLVGHDPSSLSYIKSKSKAAAKIGIEANTVNLPEEISEIKLIDEVKKILQQDQPHGILIQLPLPPHLDVESILPIIPPPNDVDGFHCCNLGAMLRGTKAHYPCTPAGILELLKYYNIPLSGKNVVVVGRSLIVGKPLAIMLMEKNRDATVTVCHSRTADIAEHTLRADIVVAAAGKPGLITAGMVKPDSVIIDVGTNPISDPSRKKGYKLVGDADYDGLVNKVAAITPVPGGVGPLTVAMLMKNTVQAKIDSRP